VAKARSAGEASVGKCAMMALQYWAKRIANFTLKGYSGRGPRKNKRWDLNGVCKTAGMESIWSSL
jgi:hypothetical protein